MKTPLFHPKNLNEAQHAAVGNCNGISMEQRWAEETPVFANAILRHKDNEDKIILDFGCGAGRLSKEILARSDKENLGLTVIGVDNSPEMLRLAKDNVNHKDFIPLKPEELNQTVDFAYLVYCLQHIPAIAIRETLQRIFTFLKPNGKLFYCSSDYRMAVRFDQAGFFDDRFLGVNLQEELSRYFIKVEDGFTNDELDKNPTVEKMVKGGLKHPAILYRKKAIAGHLFNAKIDVALTENLGQKDAEVTPIIADVKEKKNEDYHKIILKNRLSPGDILVMTCALRALQKAYPSQYQTDVRSPCQAIFDNSPYITPLDENASDVLVIDMLYPEIHKAGESGKHFSDGHRLYLAEQLRRPIPQFGMRPDIFLNQDEILWPSPLMAEHGYNGKYWVVNAGVKSDYPLKQYFYYQEVIDLLKDKIKFVQIGEQAHSHNLLTNVFDMRGKTNNIRQFFRLIHHSQGVITCVSLPMHTAAAFNKPCVVLALGREAPRWEMYPSHRYLHTTGCLKCNFWDGCWRNRLKDCLDVVEDVKYGKVPRCQKLIRPEDVARAVEIYYLGGVLSY